MVSLANHFCAEGLEVDFVVISGDGPYRKDLDPRINLVVLRDPAERVIRRRLLICYRLWRYFRNSPPRTLLATIRTTAVFAGIIRWVSLGRFPLVVREVDTIDGLDKLNPVKRLLLRSGMRLVYRRCERLIVNSQDIVDDMISCLNVPEEKIEVVYNPIDQDRILALAAEEPPNLGPHAVVACGRFTPKKNFLELIEVFARVKEELPLAGLHILGDGSERQAIEGKIAESGLSESVTLHGFESNPYRYFRAAACFVQTSLWEGFPNVLGEALACGTQVAVYDGRGAMGEILGQGRFGALVPVGDKEVLARRVVAILRKELVFPSEEAVQPYLIGRIASQYLEQMGVGNI